MKCNTLDECLELYSNGIYCNKTVYSSGVNKKYFNHTIIKLMYYILPVDNIKWITRDYR